MRLRFPLMGGLLALTAACSGHHGPEYIAATPLGMPLGHFSSESDARVPVRAWFLRVDANHDDRISLDEFEAEADATFRHYDLNGDGTIMVPELEKARMQDHQGGPDQPPSPENGDSGKPGAGGPGMGGPGMGGPGMGGADMPHPDGGGRRGGGGHGGGGNSFPGGVDPIMAADSNVDFRVTREEFHAYAQALFESLDANHDGALTEDEVEAGAIGKAQGRGGPGGGGHPGGGMGGGMGGGGHGGGMGGGGRGGGMGGMGGM